MIKYFSVLLGCLVFCVSLRADWSVTPEIGFVQEAVVIRNTMNVDREVAVQVSILQIDGTQISELAQLNFKNGEALYTPALEGIYTIQSESDSVQWLSMDLPAPLQLAEVRQQLPRRGAQMFARQPYQILALGDSVTATGQYTKILETMLRRTTGNDQIEVLKRAYSGRSNDASIRNWSKDTAGLSPDLGLIMYGLNDQGAGVSLPAYLEQSQWLIERFQSDFDADVVLLDPTPHPAILFASNTGEMLEASNIFRTQTYAAARRDLAARLGIPVADTFRALWGAGQGDLWAVARASWPIFPIHYSKQFSSMLTTDGKGDAIHPNALGHLLLARAVYAQLLGLEPVERLGYDAETFWEDGQVKTVVTVSNRTPEPVRGELKLYPYTGCDEFQLQPYDLTPDASFAFEFVWADIKKPRDLLKPKVEQVFREPGPYFVILDQYADGSYPTGVHAPWSPPVYFPLQRQIVTGHKTSIQMQVGADLQSRPLFIPENKAVGRIPIVEPVELDGETRWAVGEAVFTQFGAAQSMEVDLDGELSEWSAAQWIPVGETEQARWIHGASDFRQSPKDCTLKWSFAEGTDGIYLAFKGTANSQDDRFMVYFDTRASDRLGTAGPYTWVEGNFQKEGRLIIRAGDSSDSKSGLRGSYSEHEGYIEGEIFVPYGCLNTSAWPESGDLGVSIVWYHQGPNGELTHLIWSEDGHPWNTRWYGVVRLNPTGALPYRLRVR
jgi:lysophospholipase L1-like esterase